MLHLFGFAFIPNDSLSPPPKYNSSYLTRSQLCLWPDGVSFPWVSEGKSSSLPLLMDNRDIQLAFGRKMGASGLTGPTD